MASSKICFQFANKGRCDFKNCKYEPCASQPRSQGQGRSTKPGKDHSTTRSRSDLDLWTNKAYQGRTGRSLGRELGLFFQQGRQLIETTDGALQEVIQSLSSEGGLRRIQELIQRDYVELSDPRKRDLFKNSVLPFLELVTHRDVLASLVVENNVVTIYNCIWGPVGRRGEPFLHFLADSVQQYTQSDAEVACWYLEICLQLFVQVIELNSTAFVHEPLKPIAVRFEGFFLELQALEIKGQLEASRVYLGKLQRRLDIATSLPALPPATKPALINGVPAAFHTEKRPPGGRHDNDHAGICQIQIMPTYGEILCSQSEYLPVKDPAQWHIGGLAGLIDRNFRLLREDTIGQLRDVIHTELKSGGRKGSQKSQLRANVYQRVQVRALAFDRFSGLQFLVQFEQPSNIKSMKKLQKKEWWELSKRLQSSALVCLTDPQGYAIFCTVSDIRDRSKRKPNSDTKPREKPTGSLWEDSSLASVCLELVEPTEQNRQYILNCQSGKSAQSISLVEFPGVLLPSFQSTLLALQKMQKASDLPMSEFIVPLGAGSSGGVADVPPPAYTLAPGFSFDLRCVMDHGSSLEIKASQPVDIEMLQRHSSLDNAQALALVRALQRRVALIQGPPGTGKSYTGVALIRVLLANKRKLKKAGLGPIICVCYTNHALDQLLEDLLENNITSQIIRIGSQSKSEVLQPLNLRTVNRQVDRTKVERSEQYRLGRKLDEIEDNFNSLKLNTQCSDRELEKYLQEYHRYHYQLLFGTDEDGYIKQGNAQSIIQSWLKMGQKTGDMPRSHDTLVQVPVYDMTHTERRILYNHWIDERRKELHMEALSLLDSHQQTKSSFDCVSEELSLRCLRSADVIGVTTTGLARNLNMLRCLQSKVVICEEAGEVLEPHLLTSLLPSTEHLILIGDHQQLRPQIQNYSTLSRESQQGQQYSLDLSLFERLVEPEHSTGMRIPFCTLETQRRMHPSISQLVRDTLYPRLQDDPSVLAYPEVSGMRKRLFWLDHRQLEGGTSKDDAMATSHWNDYEIEMTIGLVSHLVKQGTYQAGDVAILTPYLGQLHRMRRQLSQSFTITLGERDQDDLEKAGFTEENVAATRPQVTKSTLLQSLRVATVDNFQGEEAKVVVISLVRSNSQNRCGFLRTENRINVLLSRAMHGMYIIGNSETARKGVEMWRKVVNILEKDGNFGPTLDLRCPRHPDTAIAVSKPGDFELFSPEGGCSLMCGKRLQCGHPCKQKCHSDLLHGAVHCLEPCPRPQKGCSHPCPKPCGDRCPIKCTATVIDPNRVLACGHSSPSLPCWQAQDLSTVKCMVLVEKDVTLCNHRVTVPCHIDVQSVNYMCQSLCRKVLTCGHTCKRQCLACITRTSETVVNVDHGSCGQKCGRKYNTCAHACVDKCHGDNPCPPCQSACDVQCGHSKCSQKCSDPCPPCAVPECLSACAHSACSMPCAAPCDHVPCSLRCTKTLVCGHQCPSICGELCPDQRFCQACGEDEIKETPVDFILGQSYGEIDLNDNPCIFPPCGHFLTMESMDAQMDIKKHYITDEQERPVAIAASSEPFSITDIRSCATCRGSLRSISRYGRLVRRALLDESTKKFILYLNRQYIPLAQELTKLVAHIHGLETSTVLKIFGDGVTVTVEGPPDHQVKLMNNYVKTGDPRRWRDLLRLRQQLVEYRNKVKIEEQPFSQVRNMVEDARRRKQQVRSDFDFDESVLQTKGLTQATALLLRLDNSLLADFLSLRSREDSRVCNSQLFVNLEVNRKQARNLIQMAAAAQSVLPQVEGYLFLAQLYALEQRRSQDATQSETLLTEGNKALQAAKDLVALHPQQTRGIQEEIQGTEKMLRGSTFYTPVSNEERMAVVAAMAREFRGTGHWYYCVNGHPFTIGECGGAMQLSTCPECGSPVGGQSHRTTDGVTRATDLEEGLRSLNI
ncbi:hypothetical protein P175DRAFT_0450803 [Aspergillus ochraceoroseus IBT 24754]|uniref:RZ-type domain-containing protein n=1 Tax=Aspergillus ochraceoroseus IBT 24754 TaxID=1392256 RepID=A0A2T5M8F8_9EURO|nr:uncharacterized protein P175DRAFT_0450803 [Aspergillus ochraceoroseus IBT 24754]PTU24827.1 hypothetical protein P175DRAFT_0450803 [Aspergillus ochraceoroseus IBT 24754]